MPSKLYFIKNMTHEAAGLFSAFAEKEKVPHAIVDLHRGEELPEVSQGDAVIVLGGPDSANDRTPKIMQELAFIRKCLAEKIPFLGICLGLQLLVKAAGGTVFRNAVKETGFRDPSGDWFEAEKTPAGKQDPLLEGVAGIFKVFQLHGEAVGLTPSMECLAKGRFCENQIVRVQPGAYGIQGHVELNRKMFEDWLVEDEDLRGMDGRGLRRDFEAVFEELQKNADTVLKNFLKITGILS